MLISCSSAELITLSFGKSKIEQFPAEKSTIFDYITGKIELIKFRLF